MNLNLWQETKPVSGSNQLVMAIYKNSAPTILVASFPLPGAYTGQTQLHTFTGLQNVVYLYKLFESPDGSASGIVRNNFEVQPNSNAYNVRDDLYLTADTSPFLASNTNFYGPDPSLVGWNWGIEQPGGVGTLQYGVIYVKTVGSTPTTQDDTNADGWKILTPGFLIGNGQQFVLHFLPQLQATSTIQASAIISSTVLLTANTTLTNSAAGQAFLLQGGSGFFTVNLPDINTVPDSEPIFFNSSGGSHINAALAAYSGQNFEFYANQPNLGSVTRQTSLALGQCENLCIYRFTYPDTSKRWLVLHGGEGVRAVGEIIYDYAKMPLNTIFAAGQLLSRTTYARLWAWVQTLQSQCLVSDSAWTGTTATVDGVTYFPNWGKFSTGDGSTTFRVPKIYTQGFLRASNGGTDTVGFNGYPGDLQYLQQLVHKHDTLGSGPGALFPNGKGSVKQVGGYTGVFNQASELTGLAFNDPGAGGTGFQLTRVGQENRPDNIGIYCLIRA